MADGSVGPGGGGGGGKVASTMGGAGGQYGGGPGGGTANQAGTQGLIVLTYTPVAAAARRIVSIVV
jgi:hypothetical protein